MHPRDIFSFDSKILDSSSSLTEEDKKFADSLLTDPNETSQNSSIASSETEGLLSIADEDEAYFDRLYSLQNEASLPTSPILEDTDNVENSTLLSYNPLFSISLLLPDALPISLPMAEENSVTEPAQDNPPAQEEPKKSKSRKRGRSDTVEAKFKKLLLDISIIRQRTQEALATGERLMQELSDMEELEGRASLTPDLRSTPSLSTTPSETPTSSSPTSTASSLASSPFSESPTQPEVARHVPTILNQYQFFSAQSNRTRFISIASSVEKRLRSSASMKKNK